MPEQWCYGNFSFFRVDYRRLHTMACKGPVCISGFVVTAGG